MLSEHAVGLWMGIPMMLSMSLMESGEFAARFGKKAGRGMLET
jgi:hypothetical protein